MLMRNTPATLTVLTFCGETGDPLPGVRYTVTNRARQRAVKTSCEEGNIRFTGLQNGIYRLEECRPPAGYRANPAVHRVAVYNGRVAVDGKFTRELRYASTPLQPNGSRAPAIHAVCAEDAAITGAGRAGRRVTVTFPNGRQADTRVQHNNAWRVCVPPDIRFSPGEIIYARQTCDEGKPGLCEWWAPGQVAAAVVSDGPTASVTGTVFPVAFDPGACGSVWERGAAYAEANAAVACLCTLEGYEVLRTRAEPAGLSGEGKFIFEGVPAGQYVLQIQRPGFLPQAQLVQVQSGAARVKHECAAVKLVAIKSK